MGLLDIFKSKQEPVEETQATEIVPAPEPETMAGQGSEVSGEVAPGGEEEKKEELPDSAM